jgi:predicted RNase H-like HicB family nuclease
MKYTVIFERSADAFGAYVPDLHGVGVVGETLAETEALIREAVALHLAGLREDGIPLPEPTTLPETIEVAA